jgi:hypothetical protein
MKSSLYFLLCVLIISALGCNKEGSQPTLTTQSISFVYESGTPIEQGACIKPTTSYAIAITTKLNGTPDGNPISVRYTLNGVADEISFTNGGMQIKKVTLINGLNVAQTIVTKQEAHIFLDLQEFELVD